MLSGLEILDIDDMRHAANLILSYGPKAVLIKGGHMEGETVTDILVTNDGEESSPPGASIRSTPTAPAARWPPPWRPVWRSG